MFSIRDRARAPFQTRKHERKSASCAWSSAAITFLRLLAILLAAAAIARSTQRPMRCSRFLSASARALRKYAARCHRRNAFASPISRRLSSMDRFKRRKGARLACQLSQLRNARAARPLRSRAATRATCCRCHSRWDHSVRHCLRARSVLESRAEAATREEHSRSLRTRVLRSRQWVSMRRETCLRQRDLSR
jgi:hypothetical protein